MQKSRPFTADADAQSPIHEHVVLRRHPATDFDASREFTFFDILRAVWDKKAVLLAAAAVVILGVSLYGLLARKVYRAEVVLMPNEAAAALMGTSSGSDLSDSVMPISKLFGGGKGPSFQREAMAVFQSRRFLADFIEDRKLAPILVHSKRKLSPPKQLLAAYAILSDRVKLEQNEDAGTIKVSVEWTDPKAAAEWANGLAAYLNNFLRQRALKQARLQYSYLLARSTEAGIPIQITNVISILAVEKLRIITLADVEPEFAMKVIDPAIEPDQPSSPKLPILIAIAVVGSVVIGFFAALAASALANLRRYHLRSEDSPL